MKNMRSLLFIPGNNPSMVQNADVFNADGIIFDLEDAVSIDEKDAARELVVSALETFDYRDALIIVRVNPLDTVWGADDIAKVAQCGIDAILVPKADEKAIQQCAEILAESNNQENVNIIALLETAYGIECASDIIKTSELVKAVLLGGEDFTANMEVERTRSGDELLYARMKLSTLCKAYNLQFIDTPFADVNDLEGLEDDLKESIRIGATGKAAINPRQIEAIHNAFAPSVQSIQWAKEVVLAWKEAQLENKGVFSLKGKMVDAPVYVRALKTLEKANISETMLEIEQGRIS